MSVHLSLSRRHFLAHCGTAVAARALEPTRASFVDQSRRGVGTLPGRTLGHQGVPDEMALRLDPGPVKQLALRAVDAAKAAGATYADVRLIRTVNTDPSSLISVGGYQESIGVGLRAMLNGYWGFAASPVWRPEEMEALATMAVSIAKANAKGPARPIEWLPIPVATGDWTTPYEIDPVTISLEEREDWEDAFNENVNKYRFQNSPLSLTQINVARLEKVMATTEGALFLQTFYSTGFNIAIAIQSQYGNISVPWVLPPGAGGWERVREAKLLDQLPVRLAEMDEIASLPAKTIDLGRYDLIGDGTGVVNSTLGRATALDHALGYHANTTGTSFLGPDPSDYLGTYQIGSPLLTVTATQAGLMKWDDEGVEPDVIPLITAGVLTDYQTTREQTGWLRPYYEKVGRPVRSHGCAGADSALELTRQVTPPLALTPVTDAGTVAELIADTKKGILCQYGVGASVDFQSATGTLWGPWVREITNGKVGGLLAGGVCVFKTPELWKSFTAMARAGTDTHTTLQHGAVKFTNLTVTR